MWDEVESHLKWYSSIFNNKHYLPSWKQPYPETRTVYRNVLWSMELCSSARPSPPALSARSRRVLDLDHHQYIPHFQYTIPTVNSDTNRLSGASRLLSIASIAMHDLKQLSGWDQNRFWAWLGHMKQYAHEESSSPLLEYFSAQMHSLHSTLLFWCCA